MKISVEQASKLLSELIAGAVVVANEDEADTNIDIDDLLININESVTKSLKPSLEEQLKTTLEPAFTGRHLGTLRSAAQRVFNVPKRASGFQIDLIICTIVSVSTVLSVYYGLKIDIAIQKAEIRVLEARIDRLEIADKK